MIENYTKDIKENVYHGAVISGLATGYTGGALINALAFSGSNFLFSSLSKELTDKE